MDPIWVEYFQKGYTYLFSLPGWLQLILVGFLPLLWLYNWITAPKKQTVFPHLFNRKSETFRKQRAKSFPPPYPNGWWLVGNMDEIKGGKIKSINAFGLSLVIFLGKDNKVGVLDAHCPHQGAHLGGGVVKDGRIQCPFHHWEFAPDGKVEKIPYFTGKNFPDYKTIHYPVKVVNDDLIFMWYHAESEPPTYELEDKSHWKGKGWYYYGSATSEFDMHVLEMAENSPDYFHFSTVHKPLPGFSFWNTFTLRFTDLRMYFDEDEKKSHIHYFDNNAHVYLWDTIPLPTGPQAAHLVLEGPGVITFNLQSIFGKVQLYKTLLPIGEFHTYCEDRIYAETSVPRWFLKLYSLFTSSGLEQDRPIWESKIFREPPLLAKGDGPWPEHRRWWNQFYSKNSVKLHKDKEMDW